MLIRLYGRAWGNTRTRLKNNVGYRTEPCAATFPDVLGLIVRSVRWCYDTMAIFDLNCALILVVRSATQPRAATFPDLLGPTVQSLS